MSNETTRLNILNQISSIERELSLLENRELTQEEENTKFSLEVSLRNLQAALSLLD